MNNLSDFITTLYPPDHVAAGESTKIAQELEHLSIQELTALVGFDEPTELEKRAYLGDSSSDENSWLEQFQGTPLSQEAIQLAEQELNMRAKHLQKRIERSRQRDRVDHSSEWDERSQFDLQKKRLELSLHKHKAGEVEKAAPAPLAGAPQAGAPLAGAPQTVTSASGAGMMGQNAKISMLLRKLAMSPQQVQTARRAAQAVRGQLRRPLRKVIVPSPSAVTKPVKKVAPEAAGGLTRRQKMGLGLIASGVTVGGATTLAYKKLKEKERQAKGKRKAASHVDFMHNLHYAALIEKLSGRVEMARRVAAMASRNPMPRAVAKAVKPRIPIRPKTPPLPGQPPPTPVGRATSRKLTSGSQQAAQQYTVR